MHAGNDYTNILLVSVLCRNKHLIDEVVEHVVRQRRTDSVPPSGGLTLVDVFYREVWIHINGFVVLYVWICSFCHSFGRLGNTRILVVEISVDIFNFFTTQVDNENTMKQKEKKRKKYFTS